MRLARLLKRPAVSVLAAVVLAVWLYRIRFPHQRPWTPILDADEAERSRFFVPLPQQTFSAGDTIRLLVDPPPGEYVYRWRVRVPTSKGGRWRDKTEYAPDPSFDFEFPSSGSYAFQVVVRRKGAEQDLVTRWVGQRQVH